MPNVFTKIQELKAELQSLQPMLPEYQQRLDKKFRLEFSYNSNHLEGNTLTYSETALLLIFDQAKGSHTFREYEEMKAHDVAFKLIKEWATDKERLLTETAIKNLNEAILVRPFWKEAILPDGQPTRRQIKVGDYKEHPNHVRLQNGEMFYYASPSETPIEMGELIEWYRTEEERKELSPVALAALLHYKFVRIHPFDDGNGRISRLLMNYVLLKHNLPPVVIKSATKKEYLFALNQADAGDLNAFVNYVAEQLVWSLELSIKAATGESVEEADDIDKEIEIFKRKVKKEEFPIRKSDEVIATLYEQSISPIFHSIRESCLEKFFDLFESIEFRWKLDETYFSDELNLLEALKMYPSYFKERAVDKMFGTNRRPSLKNGSDVILLEIALLRFIHGGESFSVGHELKVYFEVLYYSFYIKDRLLLKLKYSEPTTLSNTKSITRECIKSIFSSIKEKG